VHEASDFGIYPGARPIKDYIKNGIIILDKPSGPTCPQVDNWIKEILGIKKCSHAGTLDPRVSGVLVIAIENATKLMPILLSSTKEYVGLVNLHKEAEPDKIKEACKNLIGRIKQLPPKKSSVARRVRQRDIYDLEVLEINKRNVLIRVECQAGTYIRRLAEQIGQELGMKAHLQELRRTRSGGFREKDVVTLQQLVRAVEDDKIKDIVVPLEIIGNHRKSVIIKTSAIKNIQNGAALGFGGIVAYQTSINRENIVLMFSPQGELIAFGNAIDDIDSSKRLVVTTDRVIKV